MERSILFKGEMVRALLEGRKTQTRRIMKPQPVKNGAFWEWAGAGWSLDHGPVPVVPGHSMAARCPYGQVGERLWVQETYGYKIRSVGGTPHEQVTYRATDPDAARCYDCNGKEQPLIWCPKEKMPRSVSRITLEITGVRVERLQDISEADAKAEGAEPMRGGYWRHYKPGWTQHTLSARGSFATLWELISGSESWDTNPWVWVIEFRRVD